MGNQDYSKMRKVSIEPSWLDLAELAIRLIEQNDAGSEGGKQIVREMGEKLTAVRAGQDDCPPHLRVPPVNLRWFERLEQINSED